MKSNLLSDGYSLLASSIVSNLARVSYQDPLAKQSIISILSGISSFTTTRFTKKQLPPQERLLQSA